MNEDLELLKKIISLAEDLVAANGWDNSGTSVRVNQPHIYNRMISLKEELQKLYED